MESSSSPEDGAHSSDVAQFVALTSCPVEQAAFFLEATNGNFSQAIEMYYDQAPSSNNRAAQAYPISSPQRIPRPPPPPQQQQQQMQQRGLLGSLMNLPLVAITGSFGLLFGVIGLSASAARYIGSQVLPASWYSRIRGGIRAITQGSRSVDPVEAAESFKQSFVKDYGEDGPQWVTVGWQEATARAHGQYKFLFVYLHSQYHQDTEAFCRQTLCNSDLAHYINQKFVSWGGDVRYPDAYRLSNSLGTTGYPYVAVLAFSGARTKLIAAVEGRQSASQLQTVLQQAVGAHEGQLAVEQADANERDFTRRLREEQDAAYQQSLKEDQERERQRSEQRLQQEAAERAAMEEAAQIKAAQDAEAKKIADRAAMLASRRLSNRAALRAEPAARSAGSTALRVRLPDGSTHMRNFASTAPLQEAWDWVASLDQVDAVRFHLASSFPRKVFTDQEQRNTLVELGLAPQAALFVQVADDE